MRGRASRESVSRRGHRTPTTALPKTAAYLDDLPQIVRDEALSSSQKIPRPAVPTTLPLCFKLVFLSMHRR
jgi:hypothetical protein